MFLEKNLTSNEVIRPGDFVNYEIKLGCSSNTEPCSDAFLIDALPEPLVLESINYNGFAKDITEEPSEDGTSVKLTFNETSEDRPGKIGINDGTDYTITIVAKFPDNADPKFNGQQLINEAELTSDLGSIKDPAEAVVPNIDLAPNAEITKQWSEDVLEQGADKNISATLGGIKNTSKVGATSLIIEEPSGNSAPFASVEFTGFGDIVYPEGADELVVSYFVGDAPEPQVLETANPNAPPVFPESFDLKTITGFKFVFTSTKSTDTEGGIIANGTTGSIPLNTVLRDGAEAAVVANETNIIAVLPNGEQNDPFTAEDSFVIESANYTVDATKSFSPELVVAGDAAEIGEGRNASTVKLGLTNTSNRNLTNLTLKEPATGTSPFGEGIDFDQFNGGTWPAGATAGVLTVDGIEYLLENNDGKISLPDNLPAGSDVKGFEISFDGTFAPGSGYEFEFGVLATAVSPDGYKNVVLGQGTPSGNQDVVEDEADATLLVQEPKFALIGGKGFTPHRIEGIPGDKTTVWLNTKVDQNNTNMDVREIVQTDDFSSMVPALKANSISVPATQGATKVVVKYKDASGDWHDLVISEDGKAIENTILPEGATGVQITYTRDSGSFPHDKDVQALVNFEVITELSDELKTDNVLGVNNGDDTEGSVWVDKKIQLQSSKSWDPSVIVQKPVSEAPTNKNPTSALSLWAKNTSTYGVDKLSIVDSKDGEVNPFDYVDITGISVRLSDEALQDLAHLTLKTAAGDLNFTGADALTPTLSDGRSWEEVTAFEFSLAKDGEKLVPRDAEFWVSVGTKLRDDLRGSDPAQPIDAALAELDRIDGKRGYVLPNTAVATVQRGDESAVKEPQAPLEIITENSVDLNATLTKTFNPEGPIDFFTSNGNPAPVNVTLNVNSGTHKADYVQIVDQDPTFWNTFDFAGWDPVPNSRVYDVTIEYFTGAEYVSKDGTLVAEGGDWTTTAPANDQVQGVRVTAEGRNFEELVSNDTTIKFNVLPRYTLRSGELIALEDGQSNPGETQALATENTASAEVSRLGKDRDTDDATDDLVFNPGKTHSEVSKTSDARNGQIAPGRELNYTFTATNNGTDAILNPVITDILPSDAQGPKLILDPEWQSLTTYSFDKKFNQAPEGSAVDTSKVVAVEEGNSLKFSFPEGTKLYPGESITVKLPTTVRGGLNAKEKLENKVTFSGDNSEESSDDNLVSIIEGQAYSSRKLVREVLTGGQTEKTGVYNVNSKVENADTCYEFEGGFYRYPCIVETKPGGIAEWNLSVTNTGNVNAQHMEILDIFPYIGDTGVTGSQASTPRGSQWIPTLLDIKLPEVPAGTDMVLSYLTGDPALCKPTGANMQDPWAGCDGNWTTERPANPKEIKGIKLVLDSSEGFAPGERVSLTFTTVSETEMPEGASDFAPAWNSFGYAAQAQVNGQTDYRSQEPIKTGITFKPEEKEKVSVGDYVWIDENRDGLQDEDEKGIKDVVLTLAGPDGKEVTDVFGNPVLPTMTDENGLYIFENLPVLEDGQSYKVSIDREASKEPLAPYIPTIETDDSRENDSSTWEATSTGLTEDGQHDPTLDFGFVTPKVSVGDYVWIDENRDGIQDEDEKGIKDVVLKLAGPDGEPVVDINGNPVEATITDENGFYEFKDLPVLEDGQSYKVTIDREASKEPLAPYIPTIETDDSRENDSSTWEAISEGLTENDDHDPTLDFGFVTIPKVSVGDYVWIDENRDGIQDEDEKGIKDVVLKLVGPDGEPVVDVNGNPVEPTTTDENGFYEFKDLPVLEEGQSYKVIIDQDASKEPLAPYVPTKENGADRDKDSSTWEAESGDLTEDGQRDPTLDFGFIAPKVSVGDYVWVDENRDGIQDEDEKGIKDVVLKLVGPDGEPVVDVNGNPVEPTTTDENGFYEFKDLPVLEEGQSYTVSIDREASKEPLAPYVPTIETDGSRENDSSTWEAISEGLTEDGEHDPTLDFGFVIAPEEPRVSVGDYVWVDENNDGLQDEDEKGIKDVVLTLVGPDGKPVVDVNGNPVEPTTTDENGFYEFKDLPVLEEGKSYTVSIDREASKEALAPYVPTVETEDSRENDSSTWEAKSEGLTEDGQHDPTLDFGFVLKPEPVKTYAVGDYVWVDKNNDGLQGDSEVLDGVKVILLDGNGEEVSSTTTDKNGRYIFDELLAGDYQVKFELTAEQAEKYEFTSQDAGEDDANDSDADPKSGLTIKFTLDDENSSLTKDYADQEFKATEGIDPTWDAGVVLKPEPEPTEPTVEPTEPTEPTTPTEPTVEPTEPTTPTEPTVEPTEPTTPTEPTVEPTEPTTPTEPTVEPTEPTTPTEPTVEPTEPTTPTEPTVPTEPTTPTEPTVEPTEP
ncbi:SdrD B-like domain-containing protein, partial [Glutamicibacter sp. NPDC087661]|uniref:SdrD B-like domain-containing protein n=1 Tax=Glutamicibacter sp. NPDC087661 TaxID=3363996 RepID=UPI0037FC4B07